MTETLAPTFDVIWRAQIEDAVTRLVDNSGRLAGSNRAGSLGRARVGPYRGQARGWHSLHPFLKTVLDRVIAAVRALRDGQDTDVGPG